MRGDPGDPHAWLDDEAGPLVRSFAITGGRARTSVTFDLLAHVVATAGADPSRPGLSPEHRAVLRRAALPASIAEIASDLGLPVGVTRVLLGDLVEIDAVTVREPDSRTDLPADHVLAAVVDGLRAL
jgi:hypothetical protein